MNVEVRYRLAGGGTVVDADVVARRMELAVQIDAGCGQERHKVGSFCVGDLEERGDMPFRDDQRVAGRDGEAVAKAEGELVLENDAVARQGAERAGRAQCGSEAGKYIESSPEPGGFLDVSTKITNRSVDSIARQLANPSAALAWSPRP